MAVNTKYIKDLIIALGFVPENGKSDVYIKSYQSYSNYSIRVDFNHKIINFGNKIKKGNNTTSNFSKDENFVVLECVNRLLEKGYKPQSIHLEKTFPAGRGVSKGLDILVYDENKKPYLMIECKTWGAEHVKERNKMLKNGGQLFTYYGFDTKTKHLCLYSSTIIQGEVNYKSDIIPVRIEWETLSNIKERHSHWNKMFKKNGIFELDSIAYDIVHKAMTYGDLNDLKEEDGGKIYNQIMEILRHNVVSDKSNAFNKILNLFICKIIDENKNSEDILKFQWLEDDTDETLQMKLNELYKTGMKRFFNIDVTYSSENDIDNEFYALDEELKQNIKDKITAGLKISPTFAFKEVLDQRSFEANSQIVKEIVLELQEYKFRYKEKHQFLGDFFERLLNTSMKQESGQFFTPVPITRFIISSLPIKKIVEEKINDDDSDNILPFVIDYAAGSGHFLIEYMGQLQKIIENINMDKATPEIKKKLSVWKVMKFDWAQKYVYGIDLDDRLVKTAKVNAFFNGDGELTTIWGNGLDNFEKSKSYRGKLNKIQKSDKKNNGQFDILISNPPFSVDSFKATLEDGEDSFELYNSLTDSSSEIECLFVERMKQLLKIGGWAAVILPISILSNSGIHSRAREIIFKYFEVKAIVELGSGTFMATGTNTAIFFLERRNDSHYKKIRYAINKFFDDKKDVSVDCIEYAFSKYVANVYDGLSFENYVSFVNGVPCVKMQEHELWLDYVKAFGKNIYSSIILDEQKKIKTYLIEYLKNSNDTHKIKPADIISVKIKVDRFFVDYKEFSTEGIEKAISEFVKNEYGNIDFDDYISFLCNNPNDKIKTHPLYLKYISRLCEKCVAAEKEKLLYFLLTYQQEIVVVKTGQKQDGKQFLGYEFKERRGHEGLHWLPNGTKLYNENKLLDKTKVNSYIYNIFNKEKVDVDESLAENVSYGRMSSFFEYGTAKFDKKVNLNKYKQDKNFNYPYLTVSDFIADMKQINGYAFKSVDFRAERTNEYFLPVLKIANIKGGHVILENSEYHTSIGYENFIAKPQSIAISLTGGESGNGAVGKIAWLNESALVNQRVLVIEGDFIKIQYLYLILNTEDFSKYVLNCATGNAQKNVAAKSILEYQIPFPHLDIQKKIVAEIENINEKCNSARMIIDIYQNKIENIFNNMELIGEQSETKQLKLLAKFNPSKTELNDCGANILVSFVEMASVSNEGYIENKVDRKLSDIRKGSYTFFKENDIIIAKITPCMENGKCAIATDLTNKIGMGSSEFHVIRCNDEINNKYLFAYLNRQIIRDDAKQNMTGASGHRRVPIAFYENLSILLPALNKQTEIVAEIEKCEIEIAKAKLKLEELEQSRKEIINKYLQ
ncbi:MAG: N-6 DNA methylase [Treponema sp.]|nr:N-6 DNA methylase [Treponema sp.]